MVKLEIPRTGEQFRPGDGIGRREYWAREAATRRVGTQT